MFNKTQIKAEVVIKSRRKSKMNTIKFQSTIRDYIGEVTPHSPKSTSIYEGKGVYHRPFFVKNIEEYEKWSKEYAIFEAGITLMPGEDPLVALEKYKQSLYENGKTSTEEDQNYNLYFIYLTFWDSSGNFHKCILYKCDAYIMNDKGQTIDIILS